MNAWTVASTGLLVLLSLTAVTVCRGRAIDRVVGLQLTGVLATLTAVMLAMASGRAMVLDVALVLAVLTLIGGLAYARFLERWL
jgi:multisubunit Na+/H+ antiporter MnhF subunit